MGFIGSSYGTVLGATVAAMFPDRVDRILLDAQSNIHEYFNGLYVLHRSFFHLNSY